MINVQIKRNSQNMIISFTVDGHANYRQKGADIICAGVSTVTFGTVNALYSIVSKEIIVEKSNDGGFLSCELPENLTEQQLHDSQVLLEGMKIMISQIELSYGNKYILLNDRA
ncbi:MAG: hypothetical protein K0S34_1852 [Bacillales bacterium]|jgi:uncharacterized protein YsxB (DUF464 family)|nr:hypothetical protein [Bacillales bacterium]